jgi:hypothetical protein
MEPETCYTVHFNAAAAVQPGSAVTSATCLYIAPNVVVSYHTSNLYEH